MLRSLIFFWLGMVTSVWGAEQAATPPESIQVHPGFQVELLHSAREEDGSWISMTFDDQGRLIIARDDAGLVRVVLPTESSPLTVETLAFTNVLKHCRGLLYAHHSLYVSATNTPALYRLRDLNDDDIFEEFELLRKIDYRSRYGHGTNQILLGPDQNIYWVIGNDVSFPEAFDPQSPYRDPRNDWALPHPHDAGQDNRVGFLLKTDPDCQTWTIMAGGFRNQVDAAFNADGELFTWDADMEWDAGLPWYRPTRINHVVSGGEYGWRWGTGKWAEWYPDSLPTTHDTGYGSPTGLEFGTNSDWPRPFQKKLFAADWQNGRMLAIDLTPIGATYSATSKLFLEGAPLNICDLTFGPDGQMYFITGGRGSQTGLYRVTYVGPHSPVEQPDITESQLREATKHRAVRRELEELHVEVAPQKISFIAEHLASSDRWIRFAARVALENQPVDQWKSLIEAATNEQTRLTASLALARVGGEDDQSLLWKQNAIADWEATNETDLLWRLRSLQVSAARTGLPNDTLQAAVGKKIEAIFPHPSGRVNRLASELLAVMKSSETIPELSNLLANATTQEEQIQYAKTLVNAKLPWSLDDRERFVAWLHASRRLPGGKLVDAAMANLRADFLGQLSDEERERLTESISKLDEPLPDEFSITGPPRKFVNNWTVDQLSAKLVGGEGQPGQKDAHDVGWNVLAAASCLRCHRLGERGGRIGPDLSAVGKRYDTRALLESIVEPSKVVDPKYLYSSYALTDGRVLTGRPVGVNRNEITIETNPLTGETEVIPRAEIEETKIANISPMPAGLLNTFTPEEIAALIALLKTSTE